MAEEKKIADEIMSNEELEGVAGGTIPESVELLQLISVKQRIDLCDISDYLKKTYGIDAKIDYGKFDSVNRCFVNGEANKYSLNGESLTHRQVLNIIKYS